MPDDLDARLVVLPAEVPYSKEDGSPAEQAARAILESRGNAPRLYQNSLVFLAADRVRLQDLDEALRKFLAWKSILADKDTLDLTPHQVRQAETQRQAADSTVAARLPETYQWVLVRGQPRRFHGTVPLDPTRAGRDASRIAEEVIAHLVAQLGAEVTVTLEIAATLPEVANDHLVRTVTENSRTLGFETYEFEKE